MKKIVLLLLSLIMLAGCDHTNLTGDLTVLLDTYNINEPIPILLTVPEELADIYNPLWNVTNENQDHEDNNVLIYGGEELEELYSKSELESLFGKNYNIDRIAVFLPVEKGDYRIICYGYYKQTNPQPITELRITIE